MYSHLLISTGKSSRMVAAQQYQRRSRLPLMIFRYNPDLKVGDVVEVYVENQEDKKGQLILSHKKARLSKSWERVNAALDNEEVVQGYIKCRTKGGMIVDVFGIEAFLPGSQIDVHPIRDYDVFVGKLLFLTRHSSRQSSRLSARRSSLSLRRVRYSRVLLRTSLLTVYSLTSAVLTDSSTSQTSLGAA